MNINSIHILSVGLSVRLKRQKSFATSGCCHPCFYFNTITFSKIDIFVQEAFDGSVDIIGVPCSQFFNQVFTSKSKRAMLECEQVILSSEQ